MAVDVAVCADVDVRKLWASCAYGVSVVQVNPVILQEWDRRLKNITGEI